MSEKARQESAGRKVGGHTCPFCGASPTYPADMDSWWCGNCSRTYPTGAFKCQVTDCWEWSGLGDYCERHSPEGKKT